MACICECIPSIGQIIFTLVAFYALKFSYSWYKRSSGSKQKPKIQKEDWKKDVVYLYQFPRPSYLPNLSPFCMKIEAFLRLNDIKYEVVSTFTGRSKKGLLPFIELNGEHIADSQLIVFHLKKVFNIQDNLTDEQKSIERAFERMFEGGLFYTANWFKVKDSAPEFAAALIEMQFGKSLEFLKNIIAPYFRSLFQKRFRIEGTGKHTDEENLKILRSDLQSFETYLDDKDFFFGDKPTLVDILMLAHIAEFYYVPWHHLAKDVIDSEFPKVVKHMQKMEKKLFSDFKFGQ